MFAAPLRLHRCGIVRLGGKFSLSWSQEKDPLLHGQSLVLSLLILIRLAPGPNHESLRLVNISLVRRVYPVYGQAL
jgi:hypothetical protein